MPFDREQLEALKRQIEEDYRLDLAAVERLLRRFSNGSRSAATLTQAPAPVVETRTTILPPVEPQPESAQADELTGTLRAMFSQRR